MKESFNASGRPDKVRESIKQQAREAAARNPEHRAAIISARDTARHATRDFDPEQDCTVKVAIEIEATQKATKPIAKKEK